MAHRVREHNVSEAMFYARKTKYAGLQISELARLKHLEAKNQCLQQLYAELNPENYPIKEGLRKES